MLLYYILPKNRAACHKIIGNIIIVIDSSGLVLRNENV